MAKWHRELEIFTKIKPIIILDGNVLDVYQYPVDGTTVKGSIVRLTDYLYYFLWIEGIKVLWNTIVFRGSIMTAIRIW